MADVRTARFEIPGFGGELVHPGDADYDGLRGVFNGMIDRRPALIARCSSAGDVVEAIDLARQDGLPLSVYGGGHGVTGSAVVDAGVCVDLRTLNRIDVDPDQRIARIEGGARWGAIDAATQEHGLAVTGGRMSDTGIGGLALGSGSGWLERKFGFTCDNLLKAEIVTADGRQVVASEDENPDLYWGLRGGGGNFGVVTSLRVRLHAARHALVGVIIYSWNEADAVLRRYAAFAATAPDELGVAVGIMSGPAGEPVIMVVALWNGDQRQGERVMEDVQAFGTPQSAEVGPATYADMLARFDAWVEAAHGCHWEIRTRWLPALTAGAADAIIAAKARAASPHCSVFWHHFHGAATRMPPDGTAFGLRREHLMVEIVAGWKPDGDDGAGHRRWAQDLWRSLAPFSLPGGYANLLGPDDREQAAEAYGGNADRLRAVKRRFDSDGVFASAIPLPESGYVKRDR